MNLHELAVKRAITFAMVFITIAGFGIVSLTRLNPELLPDITFPIAAVFCSYSGVSPEDIETLITRPVEEAVSTVTNVKQVSSTCNEGVSTTIIEFEWGTDMDVAAADVREKIDLVKDYFPEDATEPMIFKFDPSMMPILLVAVGGDLDLADLRRSTEEKIEPRLERVEGVASAQTQGGLEREIQVVVDRRRLEAYGLSIQQVINTIRAENLNLPGGSIKQGQTDYTLRTVGEFRTVEEIEDIIISYKSGVPTYLKNIAKVEDTFEEKTSEIKVNGYPGVMLLIQKQSRANTVEVANKVKKELARINKDLPRIRTNIMMDQSEFINKTVRDVGVVAIQGAALAILILLLFLRNIRGTLIIALAIPMSIIASFVAMDFGGLTINMMSLGGLALAIGMLVDNGIVVLENIFRHRGKGIPSREAAILGTSEVAMPITASTLTTIAVFLPVLFVPGIAGMLFKEMALTVAFSLLVSLFVALSLIPLLCSRFLQVGPEKQRNNPTSGGGLSGKIGGWLLQLDLIYQRILNWCLNRRKVVVFGVGLIFLISLLMVVFGLVGTEFIPKMDQGRIDINVKLPIGTKLETTEKITTQVEEIVLRDIPEVKNILSQIGAGGFMGGHGMGGEAGSHSSSVNLELVDLNKRERSQWEITDGLRNKLKEIPGTKITFGGGSPGMMLGMGGDPISVEIYGYDLEKAETISRKVKDLIKDVPGTTDVEISLKEAKPEFQIRINRQKASSLGLNVATIAQTIQSNIYGTVASRFRQAGDEYDILVRLQEKDRKTLDDLQNIFIFTPAGRKIPLSNVVTIHPAVGPVSIQRKGQQRLVTVTANYRGRDLGSVTREIERGIEKLIIPSDFSIVMGGEAKEQRESFMWLGLALLGAIILVYMVMASQFESLLDPFIVMFTIPMALIGVIWMFFFTGTIFSIIAFIGVIMLAGIAVNNGIVLVDYINLLRARGLELREAVIQGGRTRLRPVLMTALTTIFAMTPMALGIGEGAEIRAPLARAVVGGLIVATLLTLILIPVIYTVFETHVIKKKKGDRL